MSWIQARRLSALPLCLAFGMTLSLAEAVKHNPTATGMITSTITQPSHLENEVRRQAADGALLGYYIQDNEVYSITCPTLLTSGVTFDDDEEPSTYAQCITNTKSAWVGWDCHSNSLTMENAESSSDFSTANCEDWTCRTVILEDKYKDYDGDGINSQYIIDCWEPDFDGITRLYREMLDDYITQDASSLETSQTAASAQSDASTATSTSTPEEAEEKQLSTGAIVGITLGGVFGASAIVGMIVLALCIRRRNRRTQMPETNSNTTTTTTGYKAESTSDSHAVPEYHGTIPGPTIISPEPKELPSGPDTPHETDGHEIRIPQRSLTNMSISPYSESLIIPEAAVPSPEAYHTDGPASPAARLPETWGAIERQSEVCETTAPSQL